VCLVVVGIVLEPSSLKSSQQVLFFRRFDTLFAGSTFIFFAFFVAERVVVLKNVAAVVSAPGN
ncbi:6882_t:CDS:1, partial [Gigaspora rosea]